jgi:hypothetical protein
MVATISALDAMIASAATGTKVTVTH